MLRETLRALKRPERARTGLVVPSRVHARVGDVDVHLGETGPFSQGVQARGKVLRIRCINGVEVRKKRPRGFKNRPRGFK